MSILNDPRFQNLLQPVSPLEKQEQIVPSYKIDEELVPNITIQEEKPVVEEETETKQSILNDPRFQNILLKKPTETITTDEEPTTARKMAFGREQEKTILGNIGSYIQAGLRSTLLDENFDESLKQNEAVRQSKILQEYPEFYNRPEDAEVLAGRMQIAIADPVTWLIPWTKIAKAGKIATIGTGAAVSAGDIALREKVLYGEVNPYSVGLAAGLGGAISGVSSILSSKFQPIDETIEVFDDKGKVINKKVKLKGETEAIPDSKQAQILEDITEDKTLMQKIGFVRESKNEVGILQNESTKLLKQINDLKEKIDPKLKLSGLPDSPEFAKKVNAVSRQETIKSKIKDLQRQRKNLNAKINRLEKKNLETYVDTASDTLVKGINAGITDKGLIDKFMFEFTRPFFGGLAGGTFGAFVSDDDDYGSMYAYITAGAALGLLQKNIQNSTFTVKGGDKIKEEILATGDDLAKRNFYSWAKHLFAGSHAAKVVAWGGASEKFIKQMTKSQGAALRLGEVAELSVEERKFLLTGKLKEYIGKRVFKDADEETILAASRIQQGGKFIQEGDLANEGAVALAQRINKFQNEFAQYVSEVGIDYKVLDNYGLTQMINWNIVNKNSKAFDDALYRAFEIQNKEQGLSTSKRFINKQVASYKLGASNMRNKGVFTLDELTSTNKDDIYRINNPENFVVSAASHFEKERVIVSQAAREEIKDFLVNDARVTLDSLISQTVPIVEFSRTFGSRGELLTQNVFKEIRKKYEPYRPNSKTATKLEQKEIKDVKQTINAYFGKHHAEAVITNNDVARTWIAGLVGLTNATRLTKVALPSLGDLVQPIQNSGVSASIKSSITQIKRIIDKDGFRPSESLGIKYNSQLERELQGYMIDINTSSLSQRKIAEYNSKFFKIVQLGRITNFAREFAFDAGVARSFTLANKLKRKGKLSKSELRELNAAGLKTEDAKYIASFKNVKDAYKDTKGRSLLDTVGFKAADRDALIPTLGNRRLFSQSKDPAIRLLGTFLSWSQAKTTQTNALIKRIEDGDLALGVRMMGALSIYSGIMYLQRGLSTSDEFKEEYFSRDAFDPKTLAEVYMLSGNFPWYADKATNLTAGPGSNAPIESLYPVAGYMDDFIKVPQKLAKGEIDKATVNFIKTLPFGKDLLYYGVPLLEGTPLEPVEEFLDTTEGPSETTGYATGGIIRQQYFKGEEVSKNFPVTDVKEIAADRVDPFTGSPYSDQMARLGLSKGGNPEGEVILYDEDQGIRPVFPLLELLIGGPLRAAKIGKEVVQEVVEKRAIPKEVVHGSSEKGLKQIKSAAARSPKPNEGIQAGIYTSKPGGIAELYAKNGQLYTVDTSNIPKNAMNVFNLGKDKVLNTNRVPSSFYKMLDSEIANAVPGRGRGSLKRFKENLVKGEGVTFVSPATQDVLLKNNYKVINTNLVGGKNNNHYILLDDIVNVKGN